jgi:hypothetical protein
MRSLILHVCVLISASLPAWLNADCSDDLAAAAPLKPIPRVIVQREGQPIFAAGRYDSMANLELNRSFIFLVDNRGNYIWEYRLPTHLEGDFPNFDDTVYISHDALYQRLKFARKDDPDFAIVAAGEGVARAKGTEETVYLTSQAGAFPGPPENFEHGVEVLKENAQIAKGRKLVPQGLKPEDFETFDRTHTKAVADAYYEAKVRQSTEVQLVRDELASLWHRLAQTRLKVGLKLDLKDEIEKLKAMNSDIKSESFRLHHFLDHLARGESLNWIAFLMVKRPIYAVHDVPTLLERLKHYGIEL